MSLDFGKLISSNFDFQSAESWQGYSSSIRSQKQNLGKVVSTEFKKPKIITSSGRVYDSTYLSNTNINPGLFLPLKESEAVDKMPAFGSQFKAESEAVQFSIEIELSFIRFYQSEIKESINESELIQEVAPLSIIAPVGFPPVTSFNVPLSNASVNFSRGDRQENSYLQAGYDPDTVVITNIEDSYKGMRIAFVGTLGSFGPANFEISLAGIDLGPGSQGGYFGIPGQIITYSQIQILGVPEVQFPEYLVEIGSSPDPLNLPITGAALRVKRGNLYERKVA